MTLARRFGVGVLAITTAWVMIQSLWFLADRDDLNGSAWVALLEHAANTAPPEGLSPCIQVYQDLYDATPNHYRQRVKQLTESMNVDLVLLDPQEHPQVPVNECTTIWTVDDGVRDEGDFISPLLARATVAYFNADSNGDAVLMGFAFGRWYYLHSWGRWF